MTPRERPEDCMQYPGEKRGRFILIGGFVSESLLTLPIWQVCPGERPRQNSAESFNNCTALIHYYVLYILYIFASSNTIQRSEFSLTAFSPSRHES